MKKFILTMVLAATAAMSHAFEFDGIELNDNYVKVSNEISKRGYVYDADQECLKGNCQGTEIYLSFNTTDVSTSGKVGQLFVHIPNIQYENTLNVFNVVYHVIEKREGCITYSVSADGTTLSVSKAHDGVLLTYNTPYYKERKKASNE